MVRFWTLSKVRLLLMINSFFCTVLLRVISLLLLPRHRLLWSHLFRVRLLLLRWSVIAFLASWLHAWSWIATGIEAVRNICRDGVRYLYCLITRSGSQLTCELDGLRLDVLVWLLLSSHLTLLECVRWSWSPLVLIVRSSLVFLSVPCHNRTACRLLSVTLLLCLYTLCWWNKLSVWRLLKVGLL